MDVKRVPEQARAYLDSIEATCAELRKLNPELLATLTDRLGDVDAVMTRTTVVACEQFMDCDRTAVTVRERPNGRLAPTCAVCAARLDTGEVREPEPVVS